MVFEYLKSLHIIFVVTWFAGLFYLVRLFVYHVEANDRPELEKKVLQSQYQLMEKRLWYGITWPSSVLALLFGFGLIHHFMPLSAHPWLSTKLILVFGLFLYHLYCGKMRKQLLSGECQKTSQFFRILNEVATLFLVSIVFLVVLKGLLPMGKALAGFILLSVVLMIGIQSYRKLRKT